jgi:hypothetical protein
MSNANRAHRYSAVISTKPADFGYGKDPAPSDAELWARIGKPHLLDGNGGAEKCLRELRAERSKLGGAFCRTVIFDRTAKEFISNAELEGRVAELVMKGL